MELKPCPFCSSTELLSEYDGDGRAWVVCQKCRCEGPVVHKRQDEDDPHWNSRPIEDAKSARIAALEAKLRPNIGVECALLARIAALEAKCERMAKCIEEADSMRARIRLVHLGSMAWDYIANRYDQARAAVEEGES